MFLPPINNFRYHHAGWHRMHLNYKDFYPTVLKSGFFSTEHEALAATVVRAGEWVKNTRVRVINVETVVLPNVKSEEEASEIGIRTSGDVGSHWYQIIRVWYEGENAEQQIVTPGV